MSSVGRQRIALGKSFRVYFTDLKHNKLSWYIREGLIASPQEGGGCIFWVVGDTFEVGTFIPTGFEVECLVTSPEFIQGLPVGEGVLDGVVASVRVCLSPSKQGRRKSKKERSLWGTLASVLASNVRAAASGHSLKISLRGVGYKAFFENNLLTLRLGYSHPIFFEVPSEVKVSVSADFNALSGAGENQLISLSGPSRQGLFDFAEKIRVCRPLEPYKGKGVLLRTARHEEKLKLMRKEGKRKNA